MKLSRAAADALMKALNADMAADLQLVREDLRRALLVQPLLLEDLRSSLQAAGDQALGPLPAHPRRHATWSERGYRQFPAMTKAAQW